MTTVGAGAFAIAASVLAESGITVFAAVTVGTGVLVWAFHRYDHLDSTSGTLLGAFGSIPWLSLLFGFLTGGAAVAVILTRRQLFRTLPAAGNIGPDTVIEELSDVVVVADSEETVAWRRRSERSPTTVPASRRSSARRSSTPTRRPCDWRRYRPRARCVSGRTDRPSRPS